VSAGPPEAPADGAVRWAAQPYRVQKAGNAPEEMEDACYPSRAASGATDSAAGARFAVADGATEASFSGLWASTLVRLHGRVGLAAETLLEGLPRWGRYWRRRVGGRALPWYAEEKLRSGAFAAFAGPRLCGAPAGAAGGSEGGLRWEAVAAGDSCLFLVRDDALVAAFPLDSAAAFGSRPALISTEPAANAGLAAHVRRADGGCRAGDTFYLMTDALAAWFLGAVERGERPWQVLERTTQSAFGAWVDAARRERHLRNDDVVLLRVVLR
jgi:hypothetical protein